MSRTKQDTVTFVTKETANVEDIYTVGSHFGHVLVRGTTRSGKSTTFKNIVLRLIERGYTVIWREFGKYDLLKHFQCKEDIIDFVASYSREKESVKEQRLDFWYNYEGNPVVIKSDDNYEKNRINIYVYDIVLHSDHKKIIPQYHELLRRIYYGRAKLERPHDPLVIMIDEASHLMPAKPPSGRENERIRNMSDEMSNWVSQYAGYMMKLIVSSHRTTDIQKKVRENTLVEIWKKPGYEDRKELTGDMYGMDREEWNKIDSNLRDMRYMTENLFFKDLNGMKDFFEVMFSPDNYTVEECHHFVRDNLEDDGLIVQIHETNGETAERIAAELITDRGFDMDSTDYMIKSAIRKQYPEFFYNYAMMSAIVDEIRTQTFDPAKVAKDREKDFDKYRHMQELATGLTEIDAALCVYEEYPDVTTVEMAAVLGCSAAKASDILVKAKFKKANE